MDAFDTSFDSGLRRRADAANLTSVTVNQLTGILS
jgi:hypothetical protein